MILPLGIVRRPDAVRSQVSDTFDNFFEGCCDVAYISCPAMIGLNLLILGTVLYPARGIFSISCSIRCQNSYVSSVLCLKLPCLWIIYSITYSITRNSIFLGSHKPRLGNHPIFYFSQANQQHKSTIARCGISWHSAMPTFPC